MESMGLLFPATGERLFRVGELRFDFELLVAQALPAELAGLGRLPLTLGVCLGGLDAEDVFDAAAGEFGHRDFAGFAELLGTGEGVVGQLDLGSPHANKMAAEDNTFNAVARVLWRACARLSEQLSP